MATSRKPIIPGKVLVGMAQVSTANTNRDGTGTLVDLVTSTAEGIRVDVLIIVATDTTTAGVIRGFMHDGTNNHLNNEWLISAITPSTSQKVAYYEIRNADGSALFYLDRNASWKYKIATHIAETFNIFAYGGDYTEP